MKKLLLLLLLTSYSFFGQATLPAYEGFNYTEGALLINDNLNTGDLSSNWYETVIRTTSNAFIVASPTWTASGLPAPSGNSFKIKGSGNKPEFLFTEQASGYGAIYASCLIKVTDISGLADANGKEFFGFASINSTGGVSGIGYVCIKFNGTGFQLGINVNNTASATVWNPTIFNVDQEIFIVIKKSEDATNNDDCQLFINPTINGTEPSPTVVTGPRTLYPSRLRIVQNSSTTTPEMYIDEIRVAKSWIEVTGGTLGVDEVSMGNLKIFPNPVSNGKLFIDSKTAGIKDVEMFNLLGQKVFNVKTNSQEINVSSLSKGAYVLKITEGANSNVKKIIIQ